MGSDWLSHFLSYRHSHQSPSISPVLYHPVLSPPILPGLCYSSLYLLLKVTIAKAWCGIASFCDPSSQEVEAELKESPGNRSPYLRKQKRDASGISNGTHQ